MSRRLLVVAGLLLLVIASGLVARHNLQVRRNRQARAVEEEARRAATKERAALYDLLRPVSLSNCELERFGEAHDGGYLMCGNLLRGVRSAYSYGISGYDQWGCDIATRFKVTTHQYDCFDLTRPVCPGGKTVFHAECVAGTPKTVEGRLFDTIAAHIARNGDRAKRIVLKMDVEAAEWDSLARTPDEVLGSIDQLAVEFHWKHDGNFNWMPAERYVPVVRRLKQFFEVAHLHFNNAACIEGLEPFPTWAYEVLFVNKRLAVVDATRPWTGPHPLDALNDPDLPECLP